MANVSAKRRKLSHQEFSPDAENRYICPEPGCIRMVALKNFMCHSNLVVELIPRVNVIVGNNGCGKSAILTAIVVCLGARSSATSRGKSVKDFIKSGTSTGSVSITFYNEGIGAYKPDEFGTSITITRTLKADGNSSYKVKDSHGHIVSSKRELVAAICCYLNIQADNPLSVLNQETSRSFLSSASDKEKYALFTRATMLEAIGQILEKIKSEEKFATEINEQKQKEVLDVKVIQQKYESKLSSYKMVDKLNQNVSALKAESFWAQIAQKETAYREKEAKLKEMLASIQKLERELLKCSSGDQGNGKKEALRELKDKYNEKNNSKAKMEQEIKSCLADIESASYEFQRNENLLNSYSDSLRVAEEEETKQQMLLSQKDELSANKSSLEQQLAEKKELLKCKETDWNHFNFTVNKYQQEEDLKKYELNSIMSQLNSAKLSLKDLKSQGHNSLSAYGKWIPLIVEKIEYHWKKGNFIKKPLGPLGSYIKVKDKFWRLPIEICLKSVLSAFVIDNNTDMALFEKIRKGVAKEQSYNIQMLVQKFSDKFYDVGERRVHSKDYPPIIDIIEIVNPVVFNCLVDLKHIETTVLFRDCKEGSSVMKNRSSVPRNCTIGFVVTGQAIYPDPNFKVYSLGKSQAEILEVSIDESLRLTSKKVSLLEEEERKARAEMDSVKQRLKTSKQELQSLKSSITSVTVDIKRLTSRLQDFSSKMEPVLSSSMSRVSKEGVKDKMAVISERQSACKSKIESLKNKRNELCSKLKECKCSLGEISKDIDRLNNEVRDMKLQQMQGSQMKVVLSKRLEEIKQKYGTLEKDCSELSATLDTHLKQAAASPLYRKKVVSNRCPTIIDKEIKSLLDNVEAHRSQLVNKDEIISKLKKCREDYTNKKNILNRLNRLLQKLQSSIEKREKLLEATLGYLGITITFAFNKLMSQYQFKADLLIDHKKQTLSIKIDNGSGKGCHDNRALSGGERSVATINLLIALWDVMNSPFRILDEFDVFMDMVNRKRCLGMLLDNARVKKSKQFVFLTPQDTSYLISLKESDFLNVLRLPDPRRS